MKTRRITLMVLVCLTIVLVLQGRFFGLDRVFPTRSSIVGEWQFSGNKQAVSKEQSFSYSEDQVRSLAIDNEYGRIFVQGTKGDTLQVVAEIVVTEGDFEQGQKLLENFTIQETLVGDHLSYQLLNASGQPMRGIEINYRVEIPRGMELALKQKYGTLEIIDVEAKLLEYRLRYGTIEVANFTGMIRGFSDFSSVKFQDVVGTMELQDNYSSMNLSFRDVVDGYDFEIEQNYGSLTDNLELKRVTEQVQLKASGRSGSGLHSVQIISNFSTITLKVE